MRYVTGLLLLLSAPAFLPAQKPKPAPEFAPHLMLVESFDPKTGDLRLRVFRAEEQEIQELTTGGGGGTVLKVEKVFGPTRAERFLAVKDCKIQDAAGKAIAAADLVKRLERGAAVVLTNDGKPPPRAYLLLLRPETVIVIGPAAKLDPRIKLPEEEKRPPG